MAAAVDYVGLHARLTPDALAARDLLTDRTWTYAGYDLTVACSVSVLRRRGVGVGDRVAVLAKNRADLIALHLACARLGAIYVPLNWRLSAREPADLVADAEPKLLLGDACLESAGLDGESIDAFAAEVLAAEPAPVEPVPADRISLILYTSGTSGRPKGVMLSEAAINQTAINFSLLGLVKSDSVFLLEAPMFHVIGLVTSARPTLMRGGAILVSDAFIPARTLARLSDPNLKVTHYFCVPQMVAALRAEPSFNPAALQGLTALLTGGAPHPAPAIRAWLDDGIVIADGYGMSEAGTVFGMPLDRDLIAKRAGSAGVAAPGVQTRIVDGHGRDVPVGEAGELWLKGENLTGGYWRRETETQQAFTADGWFRTGDIAVADADGYHWLVDRLKDMFISGGENVYPVEIEGILVGHPLFSECAVVGVPDPQWGEVGCLCIVPRPDVSIDPDAILRDLGEKLARYKIPRQIVQMAALPRNGAGKILKNELKKQLQSGASSPPSTLADR